MRRTGCYWSGSRWVVDTRVPAENPGCEGLMAYNGIQARSAPLGVTFATAGNGPAGSRAAVQRGTRASPNRGGGDALELAQHRHQARASENG
jgi:hypothetical protein